MKQSLISICYKGEKGESDIRTTQVDDVVHLSLLDVIKTLSRENEELGESNRSAAVPSILKTVTSTLEDDEYIKVPVATPRFEGETELFITHPGLYRVISADRSKAAKKFQKWLYHDVVPSIVKFGVYPPPESKKGSFLSQMAEMLAQNSRHLADTIIRQEKLENEVKDVKSRVGSLDQRVTYIENNVDDYSMYMVVRQRLIELDIEFTSEQEEEIVAWCENLNLKSNFKRIPCPSNERRNAKFAISVIDEAISIRNGIKNI